jgi:two-component sensor histidine kinase
MCYQAARKSGLFGANEDRSNIHRSAEGVHEDPSDAKPFRRRFDRSSGFSGAPRRAGGNVRSVVTRLPDTTGPTLSAVVFQTLRTLPFETRRGVRLVLVAWIGVIALQIWDSSGRGSTGVAELASVVVGTAGILLLGLTRALRSAGEPATAPVLAVRQILMALPTLGALAAALLAAAVAILIARVWLGTSPLILAIAAVYAGALGVAVHVVQNAAGQLYAYGQLDAARVVRAEAQLADAKLTALQAQMNPHFLFNALNTVAALVGRDPRAAEATVEHLADVLRMTLERSQDSLGTLADEADYVRAYLAVEKQRLGDRLAVEWDIPSEAQRALLPPLIIQPLVENAIKHGIGHRREGGRIAIAANVAADRLRLSVSDSGDGFAQRFQEGTGLGNLRRRLDVMFGPAASLTIDSSADGASVRLELPFQTERAAHARVDC